MKSNDSSNYTLGKRSGLKGRKIVDNKTDNDSLFDAIINNNYQRVMMIQKKNEKLLNKIGSSNIKNFSQKKQRSRSKDKKSRRCRNSPFGFYRTKNNESILDMILDNSQSSRHGPKKRSPNKEKKAAQNALETSILQA